MRHTVAVNNVRPTRSMIPLHTDNPSASRPAVAIPLGLSLYTARFRASAVLIFVLQILSTAAARFRRHFGGFVTGLVLVALFTRPGVRPFPLRTGAQ